MKVYQFVLLVCILEKKIECVSSCGSGQYYSDDIPGCVGCPANCNDQDARDIERCKKACDEKKTTSTPRQIKTKLSKLPKSDTSKPQFTPTPSLSKIQSTTKEKHLKTTGTVAEKFITPNKTQPFKNTSLSADSELSEKASSTVNSVHLGLAVSLGVSATFMVCLVLLVAYMWRCSRTSGVESHGNVAEIESGIILPSTPSQEPSPVTIKRSHSFEERDGIRLPLPETENLIPSVPEDNYISSLHLEENEN